jgi:hypothetical protein
MQHLEHILQKLLLKDITISTEKKVLKRGKLKLFNIKQFYIKLVLETAKSGNKVYEIPYPFGAQNYKDGVLFNYTLSSFCKPETDSYAKLKLFNKTNSSKLYDNFMFILPLSSNRL